MNNSIKDEQFFQSESSPSFKNLRIDGDSPTVTNYIHQILNSQQSIGQNITSSETPTMKRTSSFKNNSQQFKIDSREKNSRNTGSMLNQENNLFKKSQEEHQLENSHGNDSTNTSGKQKNSRIYDEQTIAHNKVQLQFTNSLSELQQDLESVESLENNELESNEMKLQNSTDQSMRLYENSSSKKSFKKSRVTKSKVENKQNRCEMSEQLLYDKNSECNYNPHTQTYSGSCSIHNQEMINFMCFTCNELLCNDCINIHIGHQIQTIKNSYPFCKKSIQTSLDVLNQKIEKLLLHSEDLTSIQNDIIETFQQQKHEISRAYKGLISSIKNQSNELLEYCSKLYNEKLEYIVKKHSEVRQGLNNMIESHRVIEKNLQLNDQFVTCDYFSKKIQFINSIINSDKQEGNQIYPTIGKSFFNTESIKACNIYKVFPSNSRLNINEQRILQQIDREFIQLKINLGKYHFKVNNKSDLNIDCSQYDEKNNTGRVNAFDTNFTSPVSRNQAKNNFISLQSSPQSRQMKLSNMIQFQVSNFQNDSMKYSDLFTPKQEQNQLNQNTLNLQKPINYMQSQIQAPEPNYQHIQNQNPIANQYYFNRPNQQKNSISQSPEQGGASNDLDISNNSQNLINSSSILNQNNAFFKSKNLSLPQKQTKDHLSSNLLSNTPTTSRNNYQDKNHLEIINHSKNYFSNNTSACSNSTRLPAPVSKSPSPVKSLLNQDNYESKNQQQSNNKETKIILTSPTNDNPLFLLNSDKTEKEAKERDYMDSHKRFSYLDDKYSIRINNNNQMKDSSIKHDLFSSSKRDNSSQPDSNNDSGSMNKFNKEIEEIKQMLYQDTSFCRRTSRDHYLQIKNNYKNKYLKPDVSLTKGSYSATHSPNRDTYENNTNRLHSNHQLNLNFPQSSKLIGEDRLKSPHFFKSTNVQQKQTSPNSSSSTPKSQPIFGSLYNQIKQERILNSHFQLEGFLNSIRKNDRFGQHQGGLQKVQSACNNFDNLLQQQPKQNHSPITQSHLSINDKSNNNYLINKITSKPYIRSISNHQPDESPIHKISKERLTEQLIQNIIKQRMQSLQSNQNCTEKANTAEVKKDH